MNYRMRQMALLLPQNGECVESCSKHASRIHTQRATAHYQWLGWENLCICGLPCQEPAHLHCTGHYVVSTGLGAVSVAKIFSPVWSRVCNARPATQRGENCTCSKRKIKRLFLACRRCDFYAPFLRAPASPLPAGFRRCRGGDRQFLLLEIYSMGRTHLLSLLGEEMSKYRERTLGRFATAIEDGEEGSGHGEEEMRVWTLDGVEDKWCVG